MGFLAGRPRTPRGLDYAESIGVRVSAATAGRHQSGRPVVRDPAGPVLYPVCRRCRALVVRVLAGIENTLATPLVGGGLHRRESATISSCQRGMGPRRVWV